MFTCDCGNVSFYSDELHLLGDTVEEEDGMKCLPSIRSIKYYTCVQCDLRYIYNVEDEYFVRSDGFRVI